MNSGNVALETAFEIVMTVFPVILALMVFLCLIRAIKGPRIAVRMGYLVDICIIYAMISFLAVTLLTKVYMGVYAERKKKEAEKHDSATLD